MFVMDTNERIERFAVNCGQFMEYMTAIAVKNQMYEHTQFQENPVTFEKSTLSSIGFETKEGNDILFQYPTMKQEGQGFCGFIEYRRTEECPDTEEDKHGFANEQYGFNMAKFCDKNGATGYHVEMAFPFIFSEKFMEMDFQKNAMDFQMVNVDIEECERLLATMLNDCKEMRIDMYHGDRLNLMKDYEEKLKNEEVWGGGSDFEERHERDERDDFESYMDDEGRDEYNRECDENNVKWEEQAEVFEMEMKALKIIDPRPTKLIRTKDFCSADLFDLEIDENIEKS